MNVAVNAVLKVALKVALMTHRGAVRTENQDALCVAGADGPGVFWVGDMEKSEVLEVNGYPILLAVVDGLGGHNGGARAARIVAETLANGFKEAIANTDFDPEADRRALSSLLEKAATRMEADAGRTLELAGMGATVAGVVIREKNALVFNCGDCRTYRFSAGELERLTREHSVVETLYEQGKIDEDEMRSHPQKNIVTSAVSAFGEFELYVRGVSRCGEDVFFLCSDGVWETLSSRQLAQWLTRPFPEAAEGLFQSLLAAGCRDNVSFLWQASASAGALSRVRYG
jgi:protein phosphatase